jgi:uncharacterized Zn finger protein
MVNKKTQTKEENKMNCPMCGLAEKHQVPAKNKELKSQCRGCGSIYYDKGRIRTTKNA